MERGDRQIAMWHKIVLDALKKWKITKSFEDARALTMWMGVAARVAPEVFNGPR